MIHCFCLFYADICISLILFQNYLVLTCFLFINNATIFLVIIHFIKTKQCVRMYACITSNLTFLFVSVRIEMTNNSYYSVFPKSKIVFIYCSIYRFLLLNTIVTVIFKELVFSFQISVVLDCIYVNSYLYEIFYGFNNKMLCKIASL